MIDVKVTPAAAIANLVETGKKIDKALRSDNPEVREMAEIANDLIGILYDMRHGSHRPQEGK